MFYILRTTVKSLITRRPCAAGTGGAGARLIYVALGYDDDGKSLKGVSIETGRKMDGDCGIYRIGNLPSAGVVPVYDVQGGALRVEWQDVRDVTQAALHRAIGVAMPQDTVTV